MSTHTLPPKQPLPRRTFPPGPWPLPATRHPNGSVWIDVKFDRERWIQPQFEIFRRWMRLQGYRIIPSIGQGWDLVLFQRGRTRRPAGLYGYCYDTILLFHCEQAKHLASVLAILRQPSDEVES